MKKITVCAIAACTGLQFSSALAELTPVADKYLVEVATSGGGVTAATPRSEGWPADIPAPIFWFDCTQTNGWEITRGEDGTNYVTKIPSLVGDGRFLTTDATLEGTTFTGWSSTAVVKPPMLVSYDDLAGGPVLDFGKFGSYRGMMFNPHHYESVGETKNLLANIGSMVALYGSQEGGGYIFGGGNRTTTASAEDYRWVREWDNFYTVNGGTVYYWNEVLGPYIGTGKNAPGFFMQNGMPSSVEEAGMNGGWQVLGFVTDAPKWYATGLGLGDTRAGFNRNGGCRIGEMMIFDVTLTQDQMRRAQMFLNRKWLGSGYRGWNGDAHLGRLRTKPTGNVQAVVDVPEGETLTVDKLAGGRRGSIVKTGGGKLSFCSASEYSAPIKLKGGTLSIERKTAPESADELPYGLYMRFDASERSSMVLSDEGGTNFVCRMNNLAPGKQRGRQIYLDTYATEITKDGVKVPVDLRPWLIENPLGKNLPLVDFGPSKQGAEGNYFCFFTDVETKVTGSDGTEQIVTSREKFYPNVAGTLIALVSAERGGGHLCNGRLSRYGRWLGDDKHTTGLLNTGAYGAAKIFNTNEASRVFVDGQRHGPTDGYQHAGCHVVAYQVTQGKVNAIAAEQDYTATETSAAGGVMFGEMLFYNRPLTDDELMEISAYLSKKWLGRDIPGYSGSASGVADVQEVETVSKSAIEVSGGNDVKVAKLTARYPLEKTGDGTLLIGAGSVTPGLTIKGGKVKAAESTPKVTADCQLAPGAAFHLDAANLDSFVFEASGGTNFIRSWYSPNGIPARQMTVERRPWLTPDEADYLNGKPVVDFGVYKMNSGSAISSPGGRCMSLGVPLDSVRSVFIVRGSQNGGGALLGETVDSFSDWTRQGDSVATLERAIIGSPSTEVSSGEFYLDGVLTNCTKALPTGGYEIIDVHPSASTHVSALAVYKGAYMYGGQRIAELVIYQRPLSEREKVATRNYLVKKWFPERELQALPEEASDLTLQLASVAADGSVIDADAPVSAAFAEGAGRLEKTGESELAIDDISRLEGEIVVKEGALALTGERPSVEPELVEEGRILHLDATCGITAVTNADMSVSVTGWESRLGDGWTAVPGPKFGTSDVFYPTLFEYELKGMPVVKMTGRVSTKGEEYFLFHKDGVRTRLEGIKSVFWVIGSQEGGGWLMGGGGTGGLGWHRGNEGSKPGDSLLLSHAFYDLRAASWRLNREDVTYASGLSGGYDLMSMVMKDTATGADADGLAFDGRILKGENYSSRTGRQRIGEIIVYNRVLSAEEREKVEGYLAAKWFNGQQSSTNAASVSLASGTTLRTEGDQYVDMIVGTGTVDGDATVRRFKANAESSAGFTVSGTLTIAPEPVFEVSGIDGRLTKELIIPVASASAFSGMENLAFAEITGVPENVNARAKVLNGVLSVRLTNGGTIMIIR